ncbi:MAG TPA: hypothetical protein VI893_07945 [Thermoplasmata archaeon]|nr:hypothetical protein [Thermoplasmata archaeon]
MPVPAQQEIAAAIVRIERRLDALSEEGSVTTRQLAEMRGVLNRTIDRLAVVEKLLAKQEVESERG